MKEIKKYSKKHIGKTLISTEGYTVEVVDGGSRKDCCTIRVDGKYEVEAWVNRVKKGQVKNLFHRSVCGVGYFGIGKYSSKAHKKAHETWGGILRRCYDPKFHEKCPTYKDVTVCDEWLNFQNYAKWFEVNYIDGYELDKDLLSDDKVYSPDTCVFIPHALNIFLTNKQTNNKSGCIGVGWHKGAGKWVVQINDGKGKHKHLGLFADIQEASNAYQKQRAIYAQNWKDKMNGILPKQIIQRIA